MTDLELLETYEPVLRFAKSERFFPMDVERYLEYCKVFPSGPHGMAGALSHLHEPLITRIGKLESEQFFLRFVNDPLSDSDAWVWWGILSVLGVGAAWFVVGTMGIEIAAAASLIAALIIFMLASPIRLRIIPAALAALFFIALEVLPIWFFLNPHETYISVETEYYLLFPFYLLAMFYFSVRTMKFIFDRIIPELPGLMMDMFSSATEKIAREAYAQYAQILEKDSQPVYYGRVLREKDGHGNSWTALQYHFFYAFNEWRLAANGMNHHEGDWELVAVYLKNDAPYAVLYSQHGAGAMALWADALKTKDAAGNDSLHPLVYVALGSHANYGKHKVIQSPELYRTGFVKRMMYWLDGLIQFTFLLVNPSEKARHKAVKEIADKSYPSFHDAELSLLKLRDERDHYLVSLPMEFPTGDGFRIGPDGNLRKEKTGHSSSYLKRVMSDRAVTHPKNKEWRRALLTPEPGWVQYRGLWGVKSFLREESGPPGPKWDRPKKNQIGVNERIRWGKPLEWLAELEKTDAGTKPRKTASS